MNGWGWMMMVVWTAVWLGLLAVFAWAVAQWARGVDRDGEPARGLENSARALLDARFARGEIDLEEYETRRQALARQP